MVKKLNVLFLCTGNSCRSQMAEGWATHLRGDKIEAFSAGVLPSIVSRRAIQVMAEAGVDISNHISKHVNDLVGIDFDYVVTVCDNAREQCPIFPGKVKTVHKAFKDPSFIIGTEEQVLNAFRKTRDQIREYIETLPESLEGDEQ
ncbi:MAG: arsenate reductase ArsC [Phycisphaerae bacterium]|nr:arsenate reductase ArsC [Phycisphaerae bacterium]